MQADLDPILNARWLEFRRMIEGDTEEVQHDLVERYNIQELDGVKSKC